MSDPFQDPVIAAAVRKQIADEDAAHRLKRSKAKEVHDRPAYRVLKDKYVGQLLLAQLMDEPGADAGTGLITSMGFDYEVVKLLLAELITQGVAKMRPDTIAATCNNQDQTAILEIAIAGLMLGMAISAREHP